MLAVSLLSLYLFLQYLYGVGGCRHRELPEAVKTDHFTNRQMDAAQCGFTPAMVDVQSKLTGLKLLRWVWDRVDLSLRWSVYDRLWWRWVVS
ncbi:hypothetical protein V8F20_008190 [Naviculisporaceae sp. PSN 640]